MFARFFDTAAVDTFADSIVAEVKRALPPAPAPGANITIAQRAEKLNEAIAKQTGEFSQATPKLGIYKKARLAARVREGMSAHGYPEPFVKAFSYDLLKRLQAAASAKKN